MLFRSSAALRWRVLRGRSLSAEEKRAGEMGSESDDIASFKRWYWIRSVWYILSVRKVEVLNCVEVCSLRWG